MSLMDDIKAKIDELASKMKGLDADADGNFNVADLQKLADDHGLGDQFKNASEAVVGPDGKLSADDARRIMSGIQNNVQGFGNKIGGAINDARDKLFGGK